MTFAFNIISTLIYLYCGIFVNQKKQNKKVKVRLKWPTTCGGMCVIITFSMLAVISFMEEAEREKKMRIVTNPNSNHCSAVYNISKMGFFGGNITQSTGRREIVFCGRGGALLQTLSTFFSFRLPFVSRLIGREIPYSTRRHSSAVDTK